MCDPPAVLGIECGNLCAPIYGIAVLEPSRAFDFVQPSHVEDIRVVKVYGELWPARFEIADVEMQERYRNAQGLDKDETGGCSPPQPPVP